MLRIGFTGDGSVWTWGWGKFFWIIPFFLSSLLTPVCPEKNFSVAMQAKELLHLLSVIGFLTCFSVYNVNASSSPFMENHRVGLPIRLHLHIFHYRALDNDPLDQLGFRCFKLPG